jgi:hypothetical protein
MANVDTKTKNEASDSETQVIIPEEGNATFTDLVI